MEYFTIKRLVEIVDIFQNDTDSLGKLLDYLFSTPIDFPSNYIEKALETPILTCTKEYRITAMQLNQIFEETNVYANHYAGKEILHARCLYLHELLDRNNPDTKKFFIKLSNYPPKDAIWMNFTIVKVMEYKWVNYGKGDFFKEGYILLIFLVLLIIKCNYLFPYQIEDLAVGLSAKFSTYVLFALVEDFLLFLFLIFHIYSEFNQMYYFSLKEYFESIWNFFDVLLMILTFPTIVLDVFYCLNVYENVALQKVFNSLSIFSAFLRLISYARGIDGSAFMVRLVIEVIIDMKYFLLFMYLFILGLGFAGYEIEENFSYSHFESFDTFFTLMLGDTNDMWDMSPDYYGVQYFFFFVASLFLPITMLNLLISIISETFGRVRDAEKLTRGYERWNILTEMDVLASKNSENESEKKIDYLLYVFNEQHNQQEEDEMSILLNKASENEKKSNTMQSELKESIITLSKKYEDQKSWLSDCFRILLEKQEAQKKTNMNKIFH